jgi:hypothetical protein
MSTDSLDVEKWIRFAQMDFDSAVALAERFRPPIEVVSYLCQQSAEKILKAYNIANTNISGRRETDHARPAGRNGGTGTISPRADLRRRRYVYSLTVLMDIYQIHTVIRRKLTRLFIKTYTRYCGVHGFTGHTRYALPFAQ